jgi:hypothetical protein
MDWPTWIFFGLLMAAAAMALFGKGPEAGGDGGSSSDGDSGGDGGGGGD